jgi:integrase
LYTHPETGKRVTGPTTFTTKADGTRWLSTVEADLHRGDDLDPAGRSARLGPFARSWLAAKTDLRPHTIELYSYLLDSHILPQLADLPIGRITTATVRDWNASIRSGRISDTTAAKAYRLLRQIMQAAVDDRLIRDNPCRLRGAATEHSRERQIPTLDEVARLADTISPRFRSMVLLAAFAGLRKGECLGLARRHLSLDADPPTVTVERSIVQTNTRGMILQDPKTVAGARTLALPDLLVDELRSHLDQYVGDGADDLLFTAERSGETPTKVMWRRIWNQARTEAGVSCTFHDLRHVAGTLNATAGATIKEAMARLGHASPVAALRYQHAVASRDAEIAGSVDKLIRPPG